jgi:hypothetical protein
MDLKKTKQALPANYIHHLDSELITYISQKMRCLYIHDAFIIDIFELHILMDLINEYFNIKLQSKSKLYSIFIIF